jgi:hypothetical protein
MSTLFVRATADQIGEFQRMLSVIARRICFRSSTTRSNCSGFVHSPAMVDAMAWPGSCIAPSRNTKTVG